MTLEQIKEYFGTSYKFEQVTGMSHNNWENWDKKGFIPFDSQRFIEKKTYCRLIASVRDLPDL